MKSTGDLRKTLAETIEAVSLGEMDIGKANVIHKLAKNVVESLYSEAKVLAFLKDTGRPFPTLGELPLYNGERDAT